jgi:type III pantothenate kinase
MFNERTAKIVIRFILTSILLKNYYFFFRFAVEMKNITSIAIDLGNSFAKIAYFINNELASVERVLFSELIGEEQYVNKLKNFSGIYSSVRSLEDNLTLEKCYSKLIALNNDLKLPLNLNYKTPSTLGKDRVCNAIGVWALNPNNHSLVVDIGTCIKFDLVTADGTYQGGSISPGVRLRYQSLNDYTANLPLLSNREQIAIVGKSTNEAIHSGVINGMKAEISYLMEDYIKNYESLTIFVTGGDAKYFDLPLKSNIFANENLTLIGLHEIYILNV